MLELDSPNSSYTHTHTGKLCKMSVGTFVCVEGQSLILCWTLQTMAREYQNGDGFGYILVFRKKDSQSWMEMRIHHVELSRYVYYNDSLTPYSPFEVKIKAFNSRGDGPFSQIAEVYSAEEGEFNQQGPTATPLVNLVLQNIYIQYHYYN